ncbi:MAG: MFS transporter [Chloroflexi bacterium]|nr:MFS transporter [Chloroflexota bacterium]MBP8059258.1 MFS transporter [Chloroflexota bacterium]
MSDPTSPSALTPGALLHIPNFRTLFLGQIISDFGDAITQLTLLLYINRVTGGDTQALALLLIALALPMATLGLVAGVFVDRWDRKRVMIISDLLRMILVGGFLLAAATDQIWLIYPVAFLHSTVGSFFAPARGATIPRIIPPEGLLPANSLSQISAVFFRVLGTAAAGFLVGSLDNFTLPFVIDSLTFLASAWLLTGLKLEKRDHAAASGQATIHLILHEMRLGLNIILHQRELIGTLVALAVTMLGLGAVNVLLAPLLVNELKLPETWFGALELAQSSAMIIGGTLVAFLARRLRATTIVSFGLMALGLILGLMAPVNALWQMFPILFTIGLIVTPVTAATTTILQTNATDEVMGRVAAALNAAVSTANLISMAVAGILAAWVGTRNVFLLSGSVVILAGVVALAIFRGDKGLTIK